MSMSRGYNAIRPSGRLPSDRGNRGTARRPPGSRHWSSSPYMPPGKARSRRRRARRALARPGLLQRIKQDQIAGPEVDDGDEPSGYGRQSRLPRMIPEHHVAAVVVPGRDVDLDARGLQLLKAGKRLLVVRALRVRLTDRDPRASSAPRAIGISEKAKPFHSSSCIAAT